MVCLENYRTLMHVRHRLFRCSKLLGIIIAHTTSHTPGGIRPCHIHSNLFLAMAINTNLTIYRNGDTLTKMVEHSKKLVGSKEYISERTVF